MAVRRCIIFQDCMNSCKLIDLGTIGPKYTWRSLMYHGGHRIYEKLDCALGNEEWRFRFPDAQVKVLARVEFLDHHPLLIMPIL